MPATASKDRGDPRRGGSAPGRPATGRARAAPAVTPDPWQYATWFVSFAAWTFVVVALLSFNPADPPSHLVTPWNTPPENWCGRVGALVSYHLLTLLGWGSWVLVGLWGAHLVVSAFIARIPHVAVRLIGALIMAAGAAGLQALLFPSSGHIAGLGGGLIGVVGVAELTARFGAFGSLVWLILILVVGAVVAVDAYVIIAPVWLARACASAGAPVIRFLGARLRRRGSARARATDLDDETPPGDGAPARAGRRPKGATARIADDAGGIGATRAFDPDAESEAETVEAEDGAPDAEDEAPEHDPDGDEGAEDGAPETDEAPDDEDESGDDDVPGAPQVFDPDVLRDKIARLPVRFAASTRRAATDADLRDIQNVAELEGYRFPGLDLLEPPEQNYSTTMESFVRDQATALERALKEYRIDGEVVGIDSGPVITLYEVRLAPGTKVAQLGAISSDLARALKAVNIRIVPNTAGRDTVGVEVPNAQKEKVRLRELMSAFEGVGGGGRMQLPMFLGKDASGNPLIQDLAQMPHLLIAGTTGSGKSVCMNTVIMSFLYTRKPNELKLVLVDPKMVELSQFKDIPHLMCPVVTEMGKAAAILEWATRKMDERYELLAEAGCRDIQSYNGLSWEELRERFNPASEQEESRIPRKLPYMVFVIDELADLIITNKEVEHSIVRLAQKARAVGIHLIVATQRPQANVVTGLIKSNMPARISFKVASGMDSRIVLDQKGGELLLGQGDMLYLSPRSSKLTRAQGTLVDDSEIRRVVRFLREVAAPSFERQLVQIRPGATGDEEPRDGFQNAQEDPLFDKAVEIVLETKRGSVSMLQRRLAIGYTRSARLIEMMGEAGIIGGHKGTVSREVLITPEEWEAMKAQAAADAAADGEGASQGELFGEGTDPAAGDDTLPGADGATGREADPADDEAEAPGDAEGDDDSGTLQPDDLARSDNRPRGSPVRPPVAPAIPARTPGPTVQAGGIARIAQR